MNDTQDPVAKDAAVEWFVRLRDTGVSDAEQAAFRTWLDEDPKHAEAYRELERLWAGLDQVEPSRSPASSRSDLRESVRVGADRRPGLGWMAAAASIVLTLAIGGYLFLPASLLADHRTLAGETRSIELPDGSVLQLNAATAVSLDFTEARRQVTLESGQAYFEVARDERRPFTVRAGGVGFTALGTAFAVKHTSTAIEIIVAQHRVRVSGSDGEDVILAAGQGLRASDAQLGQVERRDLKTALAWRKGRLVFHNAPLSEVLSDLERQRGGRILVVDHSLGKLPVTGAFTAANHEQALRTIEQTLPVRFVDIGGILVLAFEDGGG